MSDEDKSVLFLLGEISGKITATLSRIDTIESNHQNQMDNMTERQNRLSRGLDDTNERCAAIEATLANINGQETGRKAVVGLVVVSIGLAAGFAAWFIANGLNILQAGSKAAGGG